MELEYRKLTETEWSEALGKLTGWRVRDGKLARTFEFESYAMGLAFASAVGCLAERLDHHPDLLVTWRKVEVSMNTHAVQGLSPYDFELARRIDSLMQ